MSYIGVPPFGQTVRTITELTASAGQTTFNVSGGYLPGYVDVFLNGVSLASGDFTSTNGSTVVLGAAASLNDEFKAIAYWPVSLIDTYRKSEADALLATKQAASPTLTTYASTGIGFRNRIINGDMRIDQRNAGASVTATSTAAYIVDRFVAGMVGANGTMQRVSSGRTDFPFALRLTGTSSTTVCWVAQRVESVNCADLVGQSVTISFLAAASALTGVAVNLSYANSSDSFGSVTSISSQSKTITSTLTQYTVTVSSLPAGAANGLYLEFVPNGNLGTGTFTITGVQLEAGSVASPFERRDYGRELIMCMRYYYVMANFYIEGYANGGAVRAVTIPVNFPVTMRATPTRTVITAGSYNNVRGSSSAYAGLGLVGLSATFASASAESAGAGLVACSNQTESMSAEL